MVTKPPRATPSRMSNCASSSKQISLPCSSKRVQQMPFSSFTASETRPEWHQRARNAWKINEHHGKSMKKTLNISWKLMKIRALRAFSKRFRGRRQAPVPATRLGARRRISRTRPPRSRPRLDVFSHSRPSRDVGTRLGDLEKRRELLGWTENTSFSFIFEAFSARFLWKMNGNWLKLIGLSLVLPFRPGALGLVSLPTLQLRHVLAMSSSKWCALRRASGTHVFSCHVTFACSWPAAIRAS